MSKSHVDEVVLVSTDDAFRTTYSETSGLIKRLLGEISEETAEFFERTHWYQNVSLKEPDFVAVHIVLYLPKQCWELRSDWKSLIEKLLGTIFTPDRIGMGSRVTVTMPNQG